MLDWPRRKVPFWEDEDVEMTDCPKSEKEAAEMLEQEKALIDEPNPIRKTRMAAAKIVKEYPASIHWKCLSTVLEQGYITVYEPPSKRRRLEIEDNDLSEAETDIRVGKSVKITRNHPRMSGKHARIAELFSQHAVRAKVKGCARPQMVAITSLRKR